MRTKHQYGRSLKYLLATLAVASTALATSPAGCPFTLTSVGNATYPAGELSDGQIRLNGVSNEINNATFYLSEGRITDSKRRGCIVTEAPTTQFQCDLNKPPVPGFAVDSSMLLSYKNSTQFYACPATDTEYNIYVHPNFRQAKCFAIKLKASNCGAQPACIAQGDPTTVWQTVTTTVFQAVTLTLSPEVSSSSNSTGMRSS